MKRVRGGGRKVYRYSKNIPKEKEVEHSQLDKYKVTICSISNRSGSVSETKKWSDGSTHKRYRRGGAWGTSEVTDDTLFNLPVQARP